MDTVDVYYIMLCYHTRYVGNLGGLCGVNRSDILWNVETATVEGLI